MTTLLKQWRGTNTTESFPVELPFIIIMCGSLTSGKINQHNSTECVLNETSNQHKVHFVKSVDVCHESRAAAGAAGAAVAAPLFSSNMGHAL